MNCLRCGAGMEDLGCEDIQLGQYGFFTGHLSNMLSGSLSVRILRCPKLIQKVRKNNEQLKTCKLHKIKP